MKKISNFFKKIAMLYVSAVEDAYTTDYFMLGTKN